MKHLSVLIFLFVFLLLGASCDDLILDRPMTFEAENTMLLNHHYTSEDGIYSLKINEIQDSRCPEGVVCVWEGEVVVKGEWSKNGVKTPIELHSVLSNQQIQPEGFTIQIVNALPYPKYNSNSKPEDLKLRLLIKKL